MALALSVAGEAPLKNLSSPSPFTVQPSFWMYKQARPQVGGPSEGQKGGCDFASIPTPPQKERFFSSHQVIYGGIIYMQ